MRVGLIGYGAVGRRCGRELVLRPEVSEVVVIGVRSKERRRLADALGGSASSLGIASWSADSVADVVAGASLDAVVLCVPDEVQADLTRVVVASGADVVSLAESAATVDAVLRCDDAARELGRRVVVGATLSPGWSTLLARHAVELFDEVDEITAAFAGVAGPACHEARSTASKTDTQEWRDGSWTEFAARSGPELVWFPDPVGAVDCARGDGGDAVLLHRQWPEVARLVVKLDRPASPSFSSRRPWARMPEPRDLGAVRVAVSGRIDTVPNTVVYGVCSPPAAASGVLACLVTAALGSASDLVENAVAPGAWGVAEVVAPVPVLRAAAARGVRGLVYQQLD